MVDVRREAPIHREENMAKKRSTSKTTAKPPTDDATKSDKTTFQVRIRNDVHERLKKEAEHVGTSLNALIEGILDAVSRRVVRGEPEFVKNNYVSVNDVPGCIFVGRKGERSGAMSDEEFAERWDEMSPEELEAASGQIDTYGEVWFTLDFSGRVFRFPDRPQ